MICLKSLYMQTLVLLGLRTATIVVAHSAVLTGFKVLSVTKWFGSVLILSLKSKELYVLYNT